MTQRNGGPRLTPTIAAICLLFGGGTLAAPEVRFGVGVTVPGLSIGINIPAYPQLVPIPGYPVYYAPAVGANLFFYDGLYWVFSEDNWYYSSWYDGPWYVAQPEMVPDFVLRIPILYYRRPPAFFLGWDRHAAPHWGEHWGPTWEEHRSGWDRWDRRSLPQRAPLPGYQRRYPHDRYPGAGGRQTLENRYYPYKPRDPRDRSPPEAHRVPPGAGQPPHGNSGPPGRQQPRNGPQPHTDRGHHPPNRPPG